MALVTERQVRQTAQASARYFSESVVSRLGKALDSQTGISDFDVFLSHAYRDAELVYGVKLMIEAERISVYVDWVEDPDMSRANVTVATAQKLRQRMARCKTFVFVTTVHSPTSKWMPWELGYFDALRERVSVFPLSEGDGQTGYNGQEYLGLYPYISRERPEGSTEPTLWVNRALTRYVRFSNWVNGADPVEQ